MSQLCNFENRTAGTKGWFTQTALIAAVVLFCFVEVAALAQSNGREPTVVRTNSQERKFVNKIPYDVFFDNPLQLIANTQENAKSPVSTELPTSASKAVSTPADAGQTGTDEIPWQTLLPDDELQIEVKTLRNRLANALTNQSQYRQNLKGIAIDGTELAALAIIAQGQNSSLSWKENSQYVREFSTQISLAAAGLSKEHFDKTKSAFHRLTSVLDGAIPADSGDVPVNRPLHEAASRKGLMKRIEKAKDWLRQDVNSENKFKTQSAQVQHEAAIIAALATMISKKGYDYTLEDDYQRFARELNEGAREAANASTNDSFEKFKFAIDKINKSCTDCHGTYGNG